jgi:uncharacterized protein HemX
MASADRQRNALQTIFSFFLGLMVTAFIGVGVYTFYPPPEERFQDELQTLYRQQEDIQGFKDQAQLTAAERARLTEITEKIRKIEDQQAASREVWGRNTSIVLIAFATIVMSVSLIRADQLRVISNGLLLGGLFTMLYGTGWVIATGTSQARFWVMTFALVITLGLGYLKFVRSREAAAAVVAEGRAEPTSAEVTTLVARVEALERRTAAAAAALGEPDRD